MSKSRAQSDMHEREGEFLVDEIIAHERVGKRLKFLVKWNMGDESWISKTDANALEALNIYLQRMKVNSCEQLPTTGKVSLTTQAISDEDVQKYYEQHELDQNEDLSDSESYSSEIKIESDNNDSYKDSVTEPLDFCSWTRFASSHPQADTHHVKMCSEKDAKVPNFIGGILPRRDKGNREDYCMVMLTLFKPWRSGKDLKTEASTWNDTFLDHIFTERQADLMKNFHIRYKCNDARNDFAAARKKGLLPGGLPSSIDSDLQEYLDDAYYSQDAAAQLSDDILQELAEEYKDMS